MEDALASIAPRELAADWDNVGLIAGDRDAAVTRVLLCIDLMPAVVDEAIAGGYELVVAYHPPIFRPTDRLVLPDTRMEAGVFRCIRDGIAIYTPHTAFDAAEGGTNDVLAELCGAVDTRVIEPSELGEGIGQGRVGPLKRASTVGALACELERRTGAGCVSLVGDPEASVERVIVVVGAGGSISFLVPPGPGDCIVTGEIRHHDALRILRVGASAVALSHWSSERPALERLAEHLEARLGKGVAIALSEADDEPFRRV